MQACFPLLTHPTSVILLLAEMWNPSQLSQQLRVLTEEEMEKIAKEEQLWVFKHSFNLFRMPIAKDPWFLAVTSLNMFSSICSMMWHFSGRQHVHTHQITLRLPNIHWYPSSQVHKNFQFFSSYSDCKTYLATLWKQILSLRTGFEWNKRIGQWTTSPCFCLQWPVQRMLSMVACISWWQNILFSLEVCFQRLTLGLTCIPLHQSSLCLFK